MPDDRPIKTVMETNVSQIVYLIERVGVSIAVCAFLAYIIHVKLEKLGYKIDRCIRNERAIMQQMKIPVVVQEDRWDKE